jgi:hypothetical protein
VKYLKAAEMGKAAHSSTVTKCMHQGVKPPNNKGQYKSITEGEIARPRTQSTKNNTTTPPTATRQEHHHS